MQGNTQPGPHCSLAHLVEVADGTLMFLQVAIGSEGHSTGVAAEGPLHVVDVHVEAELGGPVELLVAEGTLALPVVVGEPGRARQQDSGSPNTLTSGGKE